ncbi:VOC family protein [Amycolatopsis sp. YIM 10]|uniref:VOC family protein n=1 Tax=Amycolatopsis sp. YIM 10 TaxID=2653857 RepID=UPI00129010AC|nr:VOC family protein [Amycolatopsis sp. YIM 10]QFU90216.1 Glyoxalase-like domain protein [Amycolatopsis sp. YIM 10]
MNTRSRSTTVGWFEISATDPDRGREFYEGLFGWEFTEFGDGYRTITAPGAASSMGALRRGDRDELTIFAVCDVAETVPHLESLGAKLIEPPSRTPAGDLQAVVADVRSNRIGLSSSGFSGPPVPGATAWFEIGTTDPAATRQFYQDAFGWTSERDEAAEGVVYYSFLPPGAGQPIGGIFDLTSMPGALDYAIPGLLVTDVEDLLDRCERAGGGRVMGPVSDANGLVIGQFTDPFGNRWSSFAVPPGG